MPRAAIFRGYANRIVPLDAIGSHLVANFGVERASERNARQEKLERGEKNDRNEKAEKNERIPASTNRS
jgi:hypothetical protein